MTKTNQTLQTVIIISGVLFVTAFVFKRQVSAAIDVVGEFNEDTPFENGGVVGTLGNVANEASGGILSDLGSAIGTFFSGSFFDRRTVDDLTGG